MTTVRVYNPHGNLREVRTLSDAASATAECFSPIVLTEQQVDVLNDTYPQHVHITGAPGTGKNDSPAMQGHHLAWDKKACDRSGRFGQERLHLPLYLYCTLQEGKKACELVQAL
ncbi:hypothetical protein BaRGS_00018300 [Batillaria attramentaria]|uniref:Uncharacterized protein n=1 Tax=Batillaria attramentaria TaxID=370345 RepID=A0ABD0KTK5_9CAEN